MLRRTLIAAAFAVATLGQTSGAFAQAAATFPSKSITIIVPASPGGAIDLVARLSGQKMTELWGKPVVIDNKAGATGTIGTDAVAHAAPDGHTLLLVSSSHSINPSPGGAPHMSGELFKSMTGIEMTHVPYKGSTAAHPDLIGGQTSIMFDTVAAVQPHVKSGKLRALAVTTTKRASIAPDVPTMAEAGLPGFDTSTWGMVFAPAGTPKDVVAKLNAEFNRDLNLPDVNKKLTDAGIEPGGGTPAQAAAFLQTEMVKWAKVAKDAKVQPE